MLLQFFCSLLIKWKLQRDNNKRIFSLFFFSLDSELYVLKSTFDHGSLFFSFSLVISPSFVLVLPMTLRIETEIRPLQGWRDTIKIIVNIKLLPYLYATFHKPFKNLLFWNLKKRVYYSFSNVGRQNIGPYLNSSSKIFVKYMFAYTDKFCF
jgi:hypothetical protein